MANYEVLEPGGHAALVDGLKDYADRAGGTDAEQLAEGSVGMDKLDEDVLDELDSKAYADGYYAQMTVGSADNLTARGDAVEASFIRRTSGGTADIESGNATIKSIKGNTVRWNQMRQPSDGSSSSTSSGITYTKNNDGSVAIGGTATDNYYTRPIVLSTGTPVSGHKYLLKGCCPVGGSSTTYYAGFGGSVMDTGSGYIWACSSSSATELRIVVKNGVTIPQTTLWPQLFDLTAMFGAGNEPSTIEEFTALYPLPYYEYDAGSLKPVSMTGIETTGFNQWDEEWEVGVYNTSNGNKSSASTGIRSTNMIPVMPSTQYHMLVPHTSVANGFAVILFYGVDGAYLNSYVQAASNGSVFTTPSDAHYLTFYVSTQYGTTYKNDICINLSWSGRKNGEYEEYWKAERAIAASTYFPTGLKKAGTVYDELTGPEAITRVGSVDLGTKQWNYVTSGSVPYFYTSLDDAKFPGDSELPNVECIKYGTHTWNGLSGTDKVIAMGASRFAIIDSAYTDVTTFKTAMSGVVLYYELATPTTQTIDPPLNLTYKVDDWGTERVMVPDGTMSAVPTFDIIYGMNAVDTIRRLPDLYAGKAETEAALNGKADVDGYYQQLTAGAADNLTGRGDATAGEYLFRTTAGTASVSDEGVATVKSIHGRTLVWNQLIKLVSNVSPAFGVTITTNPATGMVSYNGTTTQSGGRNNYIATSIPLISGHKYLLIDTINYADGNTVKWVLTDTTTTSYIGELTGGTIYTAGSDHTCWIGKNFSAAGEVYDCSGYVSFYDLTQMFGAGNEPSTVAEFEALFPLPYYEYDAGSLLPVNMTGIETTGFNQWDGTWENGGISATTGQNETFSGRSRSFYIPVFPNTEYYHNSTMAVFYYDGNKGFLYARAGFLEARTFTTPADCHYIRFMYNAAAMPSDTICINLSWSGYRNGEYEPYWSAQRLIDAGTLRGAGTVYDELTETERIERINAITIDATNGTSGITIANTRNENLKAFIFDNAAWNRMTSNAPRPSNTAITAVTCDKLSTGGGYSGWTTPSIQLWPDSSADIIFAVAEGISTVADLNAWLASNPLTIHYAMRDDNFVTTTYDPPLNLDYRYADFGTERIMVPDGEMSAPPIIEAVYGINATDTIRNLPTDYISHASMSQFRLALMSHLGVFINETWDEVDNRYEYTITSE